MSFIKDIPEYKTLHSDKYFLDKIPDQFWDKFHAYAIRASKQVGLKPIVNALNDIALLPPTTNWGGDFLKYDLSQAVSEIKNQVNDGNYPMVMDAIVIIVKQGDIDVDEINSFLAKLKIGYQLYREPLSRYFLWEPRSGIEDITIEIDDTKKIVRTVSQQAVEHFEQAKKQLENTNNERARKDAVRDCASAMETIIKEYGNINDIKEATKLLRASKKWGKDEIVKDGDAIFNTLHRLYPDLRHGSIETSQMTLEEALYWVDRITAFIKYLTRQNDTLI